MLEKLKHHWKVNSRDLILIICTFALGGSLCGYTGRKILNLSSLENGVLWIIIYILLISLLWPVCVLLISIPLGQLSFFRSYLVRVCKKISGKSNDFIHVAIFASGAGSNAQKIIDHFRLSNKVKISLIVCNKAGAGVTGIAEKERIPFIIISKERFLNGDAYLKELRKHHIDFIVLAGFLWKIPATLINAYPGKIVNIHPALLPKYGGKGMYGKKVHEAVIAAGEKESGITIHFTDEIYDHGKIIFQATCPVDENDDADSLAQKVHALEHEHFPRVIEELLQLQNRS